MGINFDNKEAYRDLETFEKALGRKLTASERASFIETHKTYDDTRETLDKIKELLEDSDMIRLHNTRYWDFWRLIELTEKEL